MINRHQVSLSPLENKVMNIIWKKGQATADVVRRELPGEKLKDSTIRTILRRLEEKEFVQHTVSGRTYVYSPRVESQSVATDAVRGIIEKFCGGSVENLLVGMIDDEIISSDKLKQLAQKVAKAEEAAKKQRRR